MESYLLSQIESFKNILKEAVKDADWHKVILVQEDIDTTLATYNDTINDNIPDEDDSDMEWDDDDEDLDDEEDDYLNNDSSPEFADERIMEEPTEAEIRNLDDIDTECLVWFLGLHGIRIDKDASREVIQYTAAKYEKDLKLHP